MPTKQGEKPTKLPSDMQPNELEATPDLELSEMERLKKLVAQQEKLIKALQEQNNAAEKAEPGFGGYLVRTPVKTYKGKTAGVQFRNGMALIPYGPGAADKAKMLEIEFHYKVEQINDWRKLREADMLTDNMADVIAG